MSYVNSGVSHLQKILLTIIDIFTFLIVSFVVSSVRLQEMHWEFLGIPVFWLTLAVCISALYAFDAYDFSGAVGKNTAFLRQVRAMAMGLVGSVLLTFLFRQDTYGFFGRGILTGTMTLFFVVSLFTRFMFSHAEKKYRLTLSWLFVVPDDSVGSLQEDLKKYKFGGDFTFISLNKLDQVKSELKRYDRIVLSVESNLSTDINKSLMDLRLRGKHILDISEFYQTYWLKVPVNYLNDQWFYLTKGFNLVGSNFDMNVKRWADFFLAVLMLLMVWPFMLLTALAVRLESPGPTLYRQKRVGKNGREFTIFKFRSMVFDAEKHGAQWSSKNDARITRVGKFIRASRLDELPQLFNIMVGEMSFIGPRPEREQFNQQLEKVIPFYNIRHLVRPGLTGWAQVLYPYGSSVEDSKEKLQYDLYYIKNQSVWLDLDILIRTVFVVLFGKGR